MEDELRYWMNDDTGRVIAMEECPGRLWSEIDFETYDALTRPGAKRANTACTGLKTDWLKRTVNLLPPFSASNANR